MAATIPVGCAQLAEQEQTLRHECETAGLAVPPVVGSKKRPHKVIKRKLEANITVMLRVLGRDQHVDGTRRQRAAIHLKAATLSERESRPQRDEYTLTAAADGPRVQGTVVEYHGKITELHTVTATIKKEKVTFTYHTAETLCGALQVRPVCGGAGEQLVHVKWPGMQRGEFLTVLFVRAPELACGGGCRSAHLVAEPGGFVVEINTSTDGWVTVVDGPYASFVHSTPWLTDELEAFESLHTTARVMKMVHYTPAMVAAIACDESLCDETLWRHTLWAAKADELAAVDAIQATQSGIGEAAVQLAEAYEALASKNNLSGLELTLDEKVNAHY